MEKYEIRWVHIHDYAEIIPVVEGEIWEQLNVMFTDFLYEEDIEILDVKLSGSYLRGDNRPDSDLDFDLYYKGKIDEDDLFNYLAGELEYDGIRVDINPHQIDDDIDDELQYNDIELEIGVIK